MFINLNGQIVPAESAALSVGSPMVRWGVSLIETMRWQEGCVPLAFYHWQRLCAGLKALELTLPPPFTEAFLHEEIKNIVKKNGVGKGAKVRLQIGPAGGDFGGPFPQEIFYMLETENLKLLKFNDIGLNIGLSKRYVLAPANPYSAFKRGSALLYFGAAQEAQKRGYDDVLLCSAGGYIGESSRANVFWEKKGRLFTPPLSEGIIGGVARARLLQVLSQNGMSVTEALFSEKALLEADALYLTNAVQGVRWAASCESATFAAGKGAFLHSCLFGCGNRLAQPL